MNKTKRNLICVALLSLLLGVSCGEPPLNESLNASLDYYINDSKIVDALISAINEEKESIDAAFFLLKNDRVTQALIAAKGRGVDVRVVGDVDNANNTDSPGFVALQNANIPVVFVNGDMEYLKDPNLAQILDEGYIIRPGKLSDMTHNFVILGKTRVFNFSEQFKNNVDPTLGYQATSELLTEDFRREFKQLFAGVSATSIDNYSGPTKSTVHKHPYETPDGDPFYYSDSLFSNQGRTKLIFSPQNAPIKTMIDEVYRAKGSVYIQSNTIDDLNLIKALQYKQKRGFNVKILVNSNTVTDSSRTKTDLIGLGAKAVAADSIPTIAIFDQDPDRFGVNHPRISYVLSMDLVSASPIAIRKNNNGDDSIDQYRSDYYNDGHGWITSEVESQVGKLKVINQLLERFNTGYNGAANL